MRIHGHRVRQAKIGSQGLSFHYLNGYPLHFTHIHRSSPVTELPLHWEFLKAKGLRHRGILFLLLPTCGRLSRPLTTPPYPTPHEVIGVSLGSPLPTVHSPLHPS